MNLFWSPGRLFARLPRVNRWSSSLLALLVVQALVGWAMVSTGVLRFETDRLTQEAVAKIHRQHQGEDSQEVQTLVTLAEDTGEFSKMVGQLVSIVGPPLQSLFTLGILTGILFVVVAVRTGQPKPPLLAGVVTFSLWVTVPKQLLTLWLVSQLQVSRVETSLSALVSDPGIGLGGYLLFRQCDPFVIWFWVLIGLGLVRTGQLGWGQAVRTILVLAVLAGVVGMVGDTMQYAQLPAWE